MLIAIAVASIAGTLFAQSALSPVSGAVVDKNNKLPRGWNAQAQKVDKDGVKTSLDNKGKAKSVLFSPKKGSLEFYGNEIRAKKGDKFTLTAKVKGKGKVQLSYFGYTAVSGFLYYKVGKVVELTGKEQTITETFTVQDGKTPVAKIRPAIRVFKDSTCEVFNIVYTKK